MKTIKCFLISFSLAMALPFAESAHAQRKQDPKPAGVRQNNKPKPKPKNVPAPIASANNKGLTPKQKLNVLKRQYRLGEISQRSIWMELVKLHEQAQTLQRDDLMDLLQMQAHMLQGDGYPILAAIYAAQAIRTSQNSLSKEVEPSWKILRNSSEKQPIQNLLEVVADTSGLGEREAPAFGSNWYYFSGNAAARRGDEALALSNYNKIKVSDRYFFPAKYQQAMIYVDQNNLDAAVPALRSILYPTAQQMSPLSAELRKDLSDYALMALGRIQYEKQNFLDAAVTYRAVSRDGRNFYDALFEQAWAFFMAGYPMHALGALHAAESSFYENVFNPEAPILRSMINYWLCRYDQSRNALADFVEKHSDAVSKLNDFLDRKRLDPETSYQMFENMVSGVSSASLDVPRPILQTAAEKDNMLLVRDQYASILEEKARLKGRGIYGFKNNTKPVEYMDRWASALRTDLGRKFLVELNSMRKDFENLHSQAQFLYVELLMSEKDALLGKQLHASSKITKVDPKLKVRGWGERTQTWKEPQLGEYWWDEMGYFIAPVDSQCVIQ